MTGRDCDHATIGALEGAGTGRNGHDPTVTALGGYITGRNLNQFSIATADALRLGGLGSGTTGGLGFEVHKGSCCAAPAGQAR
jgi:hypothetical protein